MNFKNIVWFIKAISYFVLLRSLGKIKALFSKSLFCERALVVFKFEGKFIPHLIKTVLKNCLIFENIDLYIISRQIRIRTIWTTKVL